MMKSTATGRTENAHGPRGSVALPINSIPRRKERCPRQLGRRPWRPWCCFCRCWHRPPPEGRFVELAARRLSHLLARRLPPPLVGGALAAPRVVTCTTNATFRSTGTAFTRLPSSARHFRGPRSRHRPVRRRRRPQFRLSRQWRSFRYRSSRTTSCAGSRPMTEH